MAASPPATAPPLNATGSAMADDNSEQMYTAVLILYLVVLPAIWIAPPAISFFRRHRLGNVLRGAEPEPAALVDASVNQLEVAEEARKRLHARVNHSLWQLGWTLCHAGMMPFYVVSLVRVGVPIIDIQPVVGSAPLHITVTFWAWALLTLSVQPIENARIDKVIRSNLIICVIFALLVSSGARVSLNKGLTAYAISIGVCGNIGFLTIIISSVNSLYGHKCFGGEPLPARRKLQRIWLMLRLGLLWLGIRLGRVEGSARDLLELGFEPQKLPYLAFNSISIRFTRL